MFLVSICQYTNKNSKCYLNIILQYIDFNTWPTQTLQIIRIPLLYVGWIKNKFLLSYFLDNFWPNRPYWVLKRQTVEVNVVGSFFFKKLQLANYLLSIHHMINCFLRGLKSHFCLFLVDKWVCLQKDVMYQAEFPSGLLYLVFGECLPIIIVKLNRKFNCIVLKSGMISRFWYSFWRHIQCAPSVRFYGY